MSQTRIPGQPPAADVDGQREQVDQVDIEHLAGVVWRWRLLIIGGVVFALAATVALMRLTPPSYEAETVLLIEQPLLSSEEGGLQTSQKLINLMPTYARLAVSDPVLRRVRDEVGTDASLEELRRRFRAAPVPQTLAISIIARDADPAVAQRLSSAAADALAAHLEANEQRDEVPDVARTRLTALLEPEAERPPRNEARTLVLAGLLGLAVMVVLAFFLQYLLGDRRRPSGA